MGMFSSDTRRENELSRIVARLLNGDTYLDEGQYASGIPALLLTYGANPSLLPWERVRSAYARFEAVCGPGKRQTILSALSAFSGRMQGQPLSVWEPVFRCDTDPYLRYAASHAAMILAAPDQDDSFAGVRRMLDYIVREAYIELLNGAFLTCDMRLLPLLREAWDSLSPERRKWNGAAPVMSHLSLEFFTGLVEKNDSREERESIVPALSGMPHEAFLHTPVCFYHPFPPPHEDYDFPQVIDAVTPVPAWRFPDTLPQVLHAWTCPEYLPRFLPRIREHISKQEADRITTGWQNPSSLPE